MGTERLISSTEELLRDLKAEELEPTKAPWLTTLAETWGTQDAGGTASESRDEAEAIVRTIKRALANRSAPRPQTPSGNAQDATKIGDASDTAVDQDVQQLRAYFASLGLPDLLDDLLDSSHAYGQAFHHDCEILWHTFSQQKRDLGPRTDFLWVRAEYIRIKDYLKATEDRHAIITGSSGIGKTWLLNYLLMVRLREGMPVLFHDHEGEYYNLFIDGKVYRVDEEYLAERSYRLRNPNCKKLADLWILTDSSHFKMDNGMLPPYLAIGGLFPKLIFASSPEEKRWKHGRQCGFNPWVIHMNPYSEAEAQLLAILHHTAANHSSTDSSPHQKGLKSWLDTSKVFFDYSPGPRFFLREALIHRSIPEKGLAALEKQSETMLSKFFSPEAYDLFNSDNMVGGSKKVVFVYRTAKHTNLHMNMFRTYIVVRLLNKFVEDSIKDKLTSATFEQAEDCYGVVRSISHPMIQDVQDRTAIACYMYKVLLLRKWKAGGTISLELRDPNQSDPPNQGAQESPQYKFSFAGNNFTALQIELDGVSESEDIPHKFEDLDDNVLYFPSSKNNEAIDFFIRDKATKICYGLSVTVSDHHEVNDKLFSILHGLDLLGQSSKCQYVHVFIKDRKKALSVPYPITSSKSGRKDQATVWEGENLPFKVSAAYLPYSDRLRDAVRHCPDL